MRVRFRSREQRNFRIIVLVARGEKKMTCCDKNRIKRIGKEIFRTQKHTLAIPYGDIVLSLTKSVCNIPHYERIAMFIALTRKAATLGGAPHKRMITSQGKN